MPNKNSSADHIPLRTCIICRKVTEQSNLLSLFVLGNDVIFDINRLAMNRKKYVCHQADCLNHLDKWLSKHQKKKRISTEKKKRI